MPALPRIVFALAASAIGAIVLLSTACGGDDGPPPTPVGVRLEEWSVTPAVEQVRAGKVAFKVDNAGTLEHELLVVKDDLPASQLPLSGPSMDEAKVNRRGKLEDVSPGATKSIELELTPGKYVLLCNRVTTDDAGRPQSHYANGMATSFLVVP